MVERVHTIWKVSTDSTSVKIQSLTEIRDEFRSLTYPTLKMSKTRGMFGFAPFNELLACFALKLQQTDQSPGQRSLHPPSLILLHKQLKNLPGWIIESSTIVPETILYFVQYYTAGNSQEDLSSWQQQWDKIMPLEFSHIPTDSRFRLFGLVDYNSTHYRFFVLIEEEISQPDAPSIKPGVYLIDPFHSHRFSRVGPLPTTSRQLRNRFPSFLSGNNPHCAIYIKSTQSKKR